MDREAIRRIVEGWYTGGRLTNKQQIDPIADRIVELLVEQHHLARDTARPFIGAGEWKAFEQAMDAAVRS